MTWLFSKALMDSVNLPCSPEPEAGSSAGTCWAGEPSAQWNVMPTPQGFWRNDKMMDASRLSQFGPTLRLLTEGHGEAVLMSFLEAFPARTSLQLEGAKESAEQDPAFGLSSLESLAKFDPDTFSWRTPQFSLLGDWDLYSGTWPRWGLMRNGECWVQPMLALRTSGTESGLWPTPLANSYTGAGHGPNKKGGQNLQTAVKSWPTPVASMSKGSSPASLTRKSGKDRTNDRLDHAVMASDGGQLNPAWVEMLMGWPKDWTSLDPMSHVEYKKWLMGFNYYDECKNSRPEVLQSLWEDIGKKAFQRAAGGLSSIPEAEALLSEMREHPKGIDEAWVQLASQETPESRVRSVRLQREIAGASHRSEHNEQQSEEYTDALQALSRFLAHYGQACWKDGSWENAASRVVNGLACRVDRLKAIGNGQVPRVAAAAFTELAGRE